MDHQVQELPAILVLGDTKVGKSTLLKNLAGGDDFFKIGGLMKSQTTYFVGKTCKLVGVECQVGLIDSPGWEDNFNDLSNYNIYNHLVSFCLEKNLDVGLILYCFREGMYNHNTLDNFKKVLDFLGPKCSDRIFLAVTRTEDMNEQELKSLRAEIVELFEEKRSIKLEEDHILFPNRHYIGEFAQGLVKHLKSPNSGRKIIEQINHEASLRGQAQMKFLLEAQDEEMRKSEKNGTHSQISEESRFLNRILLDKRDWKLSELLSEIQLFLNNKKVEEDDFLVLISNYFKPTKCKEQITLKDDIAITLSDIHKQNKQHYISRSNFKKDLHKLLPLPLFARILKTINELMVKALNNKRLLNNSKAASLESSSKPNANLVAAVSTGYLAGLVGFEGISETAAFATALASAKAAGISASFQALGGLEGFLAAYKSIGVDAAFQAFRAAGYAGATEAVLTTTMTAMVSCVLIGGIVTAALYAECWTYEGKVEEAGDEVYQRITDESDPKISCHFRDLLMHCLSTYWLFLEQI